MDDLLHEFLTETAESLSVLDVELVKLEQNPNNPELLGNIFRLMHTIKGTCGFLRLPRLEALAHAGESVLEKMRDGGLKVTPCAISQILECLDQIRVILKALEKQGSELQGDDTVLIARLDDLVADAAVPAYPTRPASPRPQAGPPARGAAGTAAPTDDEASGQPAAAAQSIRINVDLLEDLMTMVSELVLARNQCLQILRTKTQSDFQAPLQRLDHIVSALQDRVMKTRLQPVGNAWANLPRVIRDLSQALGKRIDLVMKGANTEIDRQILDLIKGPLTHMVRNAADHGLEPPNERVAAGKPETGTLLLGAHQDGGTIVIEVSDDGRGLSVDRIKQRVEDCGLADRAQLDALGDQQVMRYIFEPGFSTADAVTAVSGRGVGMDVVRSNIDKIGGTIELSSTEGQGTTFLIKIPLTLAIVPALIVECAGQRFAIPQLSVNELVRVSANSAVGIEDINGNSMLRLRNRRLPLVRLRALLEFGCAEKPGAGTAQEPGTDQLVVVTQVGASSFGMAVDRVFDIEEIVVKPVASVLRDIGLYSGTTILADGGVVMILDPNGIAAGIGQVTGPRPRDDTFAGRSNATGAATAAMLVFRAGDATPKAVPLSLVTRLEEIDLSKVQWSNGQSLVQYRGELMPLVVLEGAADLAREGHQPVVVFTEGDRSMGLVVNEIVDVAAERAAVEVSDDRPGYLGTAVIAGRGTDVIDAGYYLSKALRPRDHDEDKRQGGQPSGRRVLLVEDNPFFRNLLSPLLTVAGYDVTTVEDPNQALALCDAGQTYDVIVSDVEMRQMDGFKFAEIVRNTAQWRETPLVALASDADPKELARGRYAGFDGYVAKSDRDALLRAIEETLAHVRGAA